MERVADNPISNQVRDANSKLRGILSRAREALAGRRDFTVTEIRAISAPLNQMQQVVSRAAELRAADLELDAELKTYASSLKELQTTLEQIQFMLLARQTHLVASNDHIERMNLWVAALKQTQ